jgi:hypothetical protein
MNTATTGIIDKARLAKHRIIAWCQTFCSACATLLFRTHVNRWRKVAHAGRPPWDERNEIIAGFIPAGSSVLDIGCGAQTLRQYLKPGCKYQPSDVIQSSPDVIFCDFNAGVYPDTKAHFDYVVCSGVFEYIRKPAEFLKRVPLLGHTVLMSYNPLFPGGSKFARLGNNWVNHFTKSELENLFDQAGLNWTVLKTDQAQYLIYTLVKAAKQEPVRP